MTRKEIEEKKKQLSVVLTEDDKWRRLEKLQRLAKEVGASTTRMERVQTEHDVSRRYSIDDVITESEIVHSIEAALQTETTVDMNKTAARNFWIALISAATALLAMLAAWAAVIVKVKSGQ